MAIYKFCDNVPCGHSPAFVADSAELIGRVHVGSDASVWFGVVVRGDNEPVTIGERSNIQENCVLHTDPGFPLVIGSGVTVGHQATLHGCAIGDDSLIGIGAIVLNGAEIGRQCIVAAGSLVTTGKKFPDRTLIMGSPAKVVRKLNEHDLAELSVLADRYVVRAHRYDSTLERVDHAASWHRQ
ncbi:MULTISPECIES: gamma carbonic anhydrase family protein [Cupriavidus]|uniref:Carbonic anhydrase/acetyltransferase-like protein (Isoleucine patch superfamily) n=1 Tax=Cupriavidus alkaliphilus TaxID=942866 RepID=A0A7W4VE41_9BURK|nr:MULTISPECIES: gamma carbonic anhydrase family protein [Cupriavidus]MBB3009933.1 carbonic anhydrase/acetyltransferase-like protein (isoleucine patch superfamily) [Cupriavidus alkaliphilus]GLC97767.1 gamma carbonic anhydrase family protein [Cupriavidus sp. TA19]